MGGTENAITAGRTHTDIDKTEDRQKDRWTYTQTGVDYWNKTNGVNNTDKQRDACIL